jgi:hypothetical protein
MRARAVSPEGCTPIKQNSDNQAEAETCFQHAIRIAQNQQAKSFELRAATSLHPVLFFIGPQYLSRSMRHLPRRGHIR